VTFNTHIQMQKYDLSAHYIIALFSWNYFKLLL